MRPFASFGFVPHQLETGGTDLSLFPRNVLFMDWRQRAGERISGTALYLPRLDTFIKTADAIEMQYFNQYCDHCRVIISYALATRIYTGQKFIGERLAWETTDEDWDRFFGLFTGLGLANGERCKFETVRRTRGAKTELTKI